MNTSTATTYDVVLKRIEPIHVAAIRAVVPRVEDFGDTFDRLFGTLADYVERNGKTNGHYMAIYHDPGTGPSTLGMHVELAIPFDGNPSADDQVRVYDLPPVEMSACAIHKGLFEEIDKAYNAVLAWVQANGYRVVGPMRDVYLSCGEGDSPDYITEVQFPVSR